MFQVFIGRPKESLEDCLREKLILRLTNSMWIAFASPPKVAKKRMPVHSSRSEAIHWEKHECDVSTHVPTMTSGTYH